MADNKDLRNPELDDEKLNTEEVFFDDEPAEEDPIGDELIDGEPAEDDYIDEGEEPVEDDYIDEGDEPDKKGGIPWWAHALVIAVILVVVGCSAFALWKWNKGTLVVTGNSEENVEVEVQDLIFLVPEANKEGHVFDDEETILFLGNDALTYDMKDSGFAGQVQAKTGATCINAGFPGSTVALKNASYSDEYPLDAFSFCNVADAIATGDYSKLLAASEKFEDSTYDRSAETLEGVDFDKVDTLVIFYNAQDYLNLRIGLNPDNDVDPISYSGALNAGIKKIQEKYPYIRIVCMSFPMCYAYDSSGQLVSGDRVDFGNGKLTTYYQFMMDVCGATGSSFVDNYYGTIDEDNSSEWLLDNIHVNAACNEYMAQHFVDAIYPADEDEDAGK